MWGTRNLLGIATLDDRFIPTHVGNSMPPTMDPIPNAVHPHACGELDLAATMLATTLGSSPRMWGTRRSAVPPPRQCRFIPTHVGNSRVNRSDRGPRSVHPHACGELPYSRNRWWGCRGSSPRMWGTLDYNNLCQFLLRFIPTHVGNSRGGCLLPPPAPVHPHACGELSSFFIQELGNSIPEKRDVGTIRKLVSSMNLYHPLTRKMKTSLSTINVPL